MRIVECYPPPRGYLGHAPSGAGERVYVALDEQGRRLACAESPLVTAAQVGYIDRYEMDPAWDDTP